MTDAAGANGPKEILHESKITPLQFAILALCMIASMIEGFDIVIISYTAPAISADWGISSSELGVVFSAGVFGMTLGAMLLGWLADRFGRRSVVSLTLLVAGLATCGVMYSQTVTQLVVLRVIAGVALGVLVATLPALTGEFSPSRRRTLIISILIASANIGGFAGGLIVAELITEFGWQHIFLYTGGLTIAIAALIRLLVPESIPYVIRRRSDGALEAANRTLSYLGQKTLEALPPLGDQEKEESASVKSLLIPSRRATTLLVWAAFFMSFLVVYFVSSWMPQVLSDAGLTQEQAIQGTTALPFGAILGNVLIGWLATWWRLSYVIAVAFTLGAVCMAMLSGLHSMMQDLPFVMIWGMLFITGVSLLGAFGNLYNVAMKVYPVQIRGTGMGWAAGLGRAGAVASPTLAGLAMASGLSIPTVFVLFAAPALLAALCIVYVRMQEMTLQAAAEDAEAIKAETT